MAEQLDTYDFKRGKYPWDDWLNGRPQSIRYGTDFQCGARSIAAQLYATAALRGEAVRVQVVGDTVFFRSFDPAREAP
jgi:hypothetical protein